jgi:hypothetical protein
MDEKDEWNVRARCLTTRDSSVALPIAFTSLIDGFIILSAIDYKMIE